MTALHFPQPFRHRHPPVRNAQEVFEDQMTFGQRTADTVATVMGSWTFIIVQSILLVFWIAMNVAAWIYHWDEYPFILMNLMLSMQAAYAAPIIMMSQNRQAVKDRIEAHNDYQTNVKAEEELHAVISHLEAQNQALAEIHDLVMALAKRLPPEEHA